MGKENVNVLARWSRPTRRPKWDFGYWAQQNVACMDGTPLLVLKLT